MWRERRDVRDLEAERRWLVGPGRGRRHNSLAPAVEASWLAYPTAGRPNEHKARRRLRLRTMNFIKRLPNDI